MIFELKNKIYNKFNNNQMFEYLIAIIFVVFGIIGWQFGYIFGVIPTVLLSIALMFIFNKFKYSIPAILVLLFSIGEGFTVEEFPYGIVIPVAIYVLFILVFGILKFKKENLKNIKSVVGMSILSIGFIIPIFWVSVINDSNKIFYLMYFSWLLYTLLYVILCISLEKDSFRITTFSFSSLSFLLFYEMAVTVLKWHFDNPSESIFSFWGYVGWGLCNEVGIVLCFILPFIFFELIKSNNYKLSILSLIKLFVAFAGIILTTSRGSYVCAFLEGLILFIVLIFSKNKLKLFKILSILSIAILALIFICIKFNIVDIFNSVKEKIFNNEYGFLNGRDVKWNAGAAVFMASYRNIFFGSGIVSEIIETEVFNKIQYTYIVYHSTTMEILVSAGLIGLIGLGIHFFEKYKMLLNKGKLFFIVFGIGYLTVDLYGLIDNTYGMYYYMVPLCIMMAVINNSNDFELFKDNN